MAERRNCNLVEGWFKLKIICISTVAYNNKHSSLQYFFPLVYRKVPSTHTLTSNNYTNKNTQWPCPIFVKTIYSVAFYFSCILCNRHIGTHECSIFASTYLWSNRARYTAIDLSKMSARKQYCLTFSLVSQ